MVTARKQYQKMLRRKEKRKFILLELEKTEKDYIDDIRIVIEHVMKQVEEILDEEMYKMLFINLGRSSRYTQCSTSGWPTLCRATTTTPPRSASSSCT